MANPRTPRYFPKMKVRGARRRKLAPFQRAMGAFDRLQTTAEEAGKTFSTLMKLVNREQS